MSAIRPAEQRYVRALRGVAKAIAREYIARLSPYLDQVARADAARWDVATLLNQLSVIGVEVQIAIPRTVGPLFDRMSGAVSKGNARGQAELLGIKPANIAGPGDAIAKAREANIALIDKAHGEYANQIRDILNDPENFGLRVEDLKNKLLERGDVSESRAELIARDQTLKLNGAITAERQQAAGVDSYVWSTSLDDRVRDEHAILEGQTFAWSDPPEPGHPGEDIQCRCVAVPVVAELDEVFSDGGEG